MRVVRVKGSTPKPLLMIFPMTEKARPIWPKWVKELMKMLRVTREGLGVPFESKWEQRETTVEKCFVFMIDERSLLRETMEGGGWRWRGQVR